MTAELPPHEDVDESRARLVIWQAVCDAAEALAPGCLVYRSRERDEAQRLSFETSVRDVETWKLVEVLSLLAILGRSERVRETAIYNVFGRTGPIAFDEDGVTRYLWAQPDVSGEASLLGSRPDLVITSTSSLPSAATILRVVECKARKSLDAATIRAEFGKAHDLRVLSYTLWSLSAPAPRYVDGAKRLGLNLETLAFDTKAKEWQDDARSLVNYVAGRLEDVRREERFAQLAIGSGEEISSKLLLSR